MTPEELYEAASKDGGATPVAELANAAGLRTPAFITAVMGHAQERGLPVPTFTFHRVKPNALALAPRRETGRHDLRISATALAFLGAGEVQAFTMERGEGGAIILRPAG